MMFFVLLLCSGAIMQTSDAVTVNIPSTTDPLILYCTTDRDCPETSYCYPFGKKRMCTRCFDCTTRFRQNRIQCAHEVQNCGDCLPGYRSNTYAHVISWCQAEIVAEPQKSDNIVIAIDSKWIAVFIICCIFLLGLASYHYICHKRRDIIVSDSISMSELNRRYNYSTSMPGPPPPYSKTHEMGDDNISCSFELTVEEKSVHEQKAVPYILDMTANDDNSGNGPFSSYSHGSQGSSSAATPFSPSNIDIHDENTTPSYWTPGTSYGSVVAATTSQALNIVKEDEELAPPNKRQKTGEEKK